MTTRKVSGHPDFFVRLERKPLDAHANTFVREYTVELDPWSLSPQREQHESGSSTAYSFISARASPSCARVYAAKRLQDRSDLYAR